MKKIYTIEITGCSKKGIWYESKMNRQFDAELFSNGDIRKNMQVITFQVNPCQFVYQIDCKVISERLVEVYSKP